MGLGSFVVVVVGFVGGGTRKNGEHIVVRVMYTGSKVFEGSEIMERWAEHAVCCW